MPSGDLRPAMSKSCPLLVYNWQSMFGDCVVSVHEVMRGDIGKKLVMNFLYTQSRVDIVSKRVDQVGFRVRMVTMAPKYNPLRGAFFSSGTSTKAKADRRHGVQSAET